MCGLIGFVSHDPAAPIIVDALKKLEYRGYDSAGIATIADNQIHFRKGVGPLAQV